MEPLVFGNLYSLIAAELGKPSSRVEESFATDGEAMADETGKAFGQHTFSYKLVEPIKSPDGAITLLAEGADLSKFLPSVLSRQQQSPNRSIGPIALAPSEAVVGHYRKRILNRLTPAVEDARANPTPVISRLFRAVKPEHRGQMDDALGKAVNRPLASSKGLMTMLEALENDRFDALWKKSIQSAYAGMALMTGVSDATATEPLGSALEVVGSAALYQNLGEMVSRVDEATGARLTSGMLAEAVGLSPRISEIIEQRHRYVRSAEESLESEEPESRTPGNQDASVEARVLAVADIFVTAIHERRGSGSDIEAIKALNFMVSRGKIDKRAVVALTRLYLSHKFAIFFEKAIEIAAMCPFESEAEPILWNILGERNPQKFICKRMECAYMGSQTTLVSQTIPVTFDGKVVGKIPKGEYNSCRQLTGELAKLYKEIAAITSA